VSVQESRRSPLHDEWAVKVKQRARWTCEGCGLTSDQIKARGGRLEAAHILPHSEYPELRYRLDNGRALCTFRNRRHPEGLGNGYGCHNAMSGHWGHAYGVMPGAVHHSPSRAVTLLGVALLGLSGAFAYLVFFRGWPSSWTTEALACAAGAMPCLSARHRLGWATFDLGTALWFVLAGVDLLARSRWHVGISPYHFGVFLFASVGAYAGCLLAAHIALRGHWISRFTRACLHGLVRGLRRARGPRRVPKQV
jgi:hypothetical protein